MPLGELVVSFLQFIAGVILKLVLRESFDHLFNGLPEVGFDQNVLIGNLVVPFQSRHDPFLEGRIQRPGNAVVEAAREPLPKMQYRSGEFSDPSLHPASLALPPSLRKEIEKVGLGARCEIVYAYTQPEVEPCSPASLPG